MPGGGPPGGPGGKRVGCGPGGGNPRGKSSLPGKCAQWGGCPWGMCMASGGTGDMSLGTLSSPEMWRGEGIRGINKETKRGLQESVAACSNLLLHPQPLLSPSRIEARDAISLLNKRTLFQLT